MARIPELNPRYSQISFRVLGVLQNKTIPYPPIPLVPQQPHSPPYLYNFTIKAPSFIQKFRLWQVIFLHRSANCRDSRVPIFCYFQHFQFRRNYRIPRVRLHFPQLIDLDSSIFHPVPDLYSIFKHYDLYWHPRYEYFIVPMPMHSVLLL